jgi:peptide/nickel transport system substrate-binding protein
VSPLTARTQADRDLVALLFSGLVRNGPGGTIVPDLAERWSVDKTGKTWTVDIRPDARWHDGEPVTPEDVVYTIETLQDEAYTGPSATSWSEVTVDVTGPRQVRFTLETPLGGFLQALTQPIAPAHLLADVPIEQLADDPFDGQPVGSGPFALTELTDTSASLVPAEIVPEAGAPSPSSPAVSPDSLTTPGPTLRPSRPLPYLAGIDFRYYDSPDSLVEDFKAGKLDAASGLPPAMTADLGRTAGARLVRYPGATLTSVLLNQRPNHPEFGAPGVRTGLLAALDRSDIIDSAFGGVAADATSPIPPASPMFDAAADPAVDYSRRAAEKALTTAKWTKDAKGWHLPGSKQPVATTVLSPTKESNAELFEAAEGVVRDWAAIGLTAEHEAVAPAEFGKRLSSGEFQAAVADLRIGLDPDLYPLLASSQTLTGGSNVMGVQSAELDELLERARAPGSVSARKASYSALEKGLAAGRYLLPLAYADEAVVLRDTVVGPTARQVTDGSDRFWDVLTWRLAVGR